MSNRVTPVIPSEPAKPKDSVSLELVVHILNCELSIDVAVITGCDHVYY